MIKLAGTTRKTASRNQAKVSQEVSIEELAAVCRERDSLAEQLAEVITQRDALIVALFRSGDSNGPEIARVTGLTTAGVYKIRNRRLALERADENQRGVV